jgi:hypothetical protein
MTFPNGDSKPFWGLNPGKCRKQSLLANRLKKDKTPFEIGGFEFRIEQ